MSRTRHEVMTEGSTKVFTKELIYFMMVALSLVRLLSLRKVKFLLTAWYVYS